MQTAETHERLSGQVFATFADGIRWSSLPQPVQHRARLAFRDALGTMVAGCRTAAARAAADASRSDGSSGPVEVLATRRRAGRVGAALANAVAASSLDFDDGHVLGGSIHPGAAIVPALLAAGAHRQRTIKQALEGLVAAYEVAIRAGYVLWPEDRSYQAHLAGTAAAIGGAVGCAKLIGLSADGQLRALEIGWAHAPLARLQFPMVKESLGWAAATSVGASLLAEAGFKRRRSADIPPFAQEVHPPTGFDVPGVGDRGFVGDLGRRWEIENTYFKPYAACRFTHSAADAVKQVWPADRSTDDIERIVVSTHREAAYLDGQRPSTIEEAQYSFPWVVAAILLDGEVGPMQMNEERLADDAMMAMAQRVTVAHDPALDLAYPGAYPSRVAVHLASGETLERQVDVPLGAPEHPMSDPQLEAKFQSLVAPILPGHASELSELIMDGEDEPLDAVFALLRTQPRHK